MRCNAEFISTEMWHGVFQKMTGTEVRFPMPHAGPSVSRFYPWMWSIPATTLTWASIAIFLFVYAYILCVPITRSSFFLPFFDGAWAGIPRVVFGSLFVFGLTIWMTMKLRTRPKRLLAKVWLLFLCVIALVGVVASTFLFFGKINASVFSVPLLVWAHTILFSVLSALCILLFRLYKPLPDSRWIQRAAPFAFLLMLPTIVATVLLSGAYTENFKSEWANAQIEELKKQFDTAVQEGDLSELVDAQKSFDKTRKALIELGDEQGLKELDELRKEFSALQQKLIAELDADELLKWTITYNKTPVIAYDFNTYQYSFNPEAAGKYRSNAVLFKNINASLLSMQGLSQAEKNSKNQEVYEKERKRVQNKLDTVINNWSDRWITFLLPEVYNEIIFDKTTYIKDLVNRPFLSLQDREGSLKEFKLSSLEDLLRTKINVSNAEQFAQENGCYQGALFNRRRYFAIVCQAYMSDSENNVFPLLSIRMVYTRSGTPFEIGIIMPSYKDEPTSSINLDRMKFLRAIQSSPKNLATQSLKYKDWSNHTYYEDNSLYYSRITLAEQ